jgi:hypothetical protein
LSQIKSIKKGEIMGSFNAMLPRVTVASIKKNFIRSAAALILLASGIASAGVVTTTPGDNEPLPGTDLALLYYQHAERDRVNVNGRSAVPDFRLTSDIALLVSSTGPHWVVSSSPLKSFFLSDVWICVVLATRL